MKKEDVIAFPTQGGTFTGYEVQVDKPHRGWQSILFDRVDVSNGVPLPMAHRGILDTMDFLGYEQAQSLAWMVKAVAASENKKVEVRIMPHSISYDVKCYKCEEDVMYVGELTKEET